MFLFANETVWEILTEFTHWYFILAPMILAHTLHLHGDAYRLPTITVFSLIWVRNLILCIHHFYV